MPVTVNRDRRQFDHWARELVQDRLSAKPCADVFASILGFHVAPAWEWDADFFTCAT